MKRLLITPSVIIAAICVSTLSTAKAATIISGAATFTLLEGKADSISEFDALFNASATRADSLAHPAPGNAPFTETASSVVYSDPIRPHGVIATVGTPGAARTEQVTNLDFNTSNILGSWGASTDSFGTFVNTVPGVSEQIGFTSIQRWTGPFTGVLVYGDFALRYVPTLAGTVQSGGTLSGLVLTSNVDFLNASWASVANASISFSGDTLSISGDLLISGALNVLDPTAVIGEKFGTFSMTALVVPEPSRGLLLLVAMSGFILRRRVGSQRISEASGQDRRVES